MPHTLSSYKRTPNNIFDGNEGNKTTATILFNYVRDPLRYGRKKLKKTNQTKKKLIKQHVVCGV